MNDIKEVERNSLTLFVKKAITSKKVCIILQAVKNALMLILAAKMHTPNEILAG